MSNMDYGSIVFPARRCCFKSWPITSSGNVQFQRASRSYRPLNGGSRWGQAAFPLFGLLLMLVRMSPQVRQSRFPENFPACGFLAKQIFRSAASVALLRPYGCSPCSFDMPENGHRNPNKGKTS